MKFKYYMKQEQATDPVDLTGGGAPDTTTTTDPVEPTTISEGWLAGVDSELANDPSMGAIKDINSLVKSYIHGQKMVGKDKIVLPDEHATEEDISAFYNKLGRPELDKYEVDFGEAKYGDDFKKSFIETAHKAGVMPKQAEAMFGFLHGQIETSNAEAAEAQKLTQQENLASLRKEWGNGFDKQVATAREALNTLADDSFKNYLKESGLATDPTLIKFFANLGSKMNEDTFDPNAVKHFGLTKDEAKDKANSMMADMDHPYWNKDHPNHSKAVADMLKYQEVLAS